MLFILMNDLSINEGYLFSTSFFIKLLIFHFFIKLYFKVCFYSPLCKEFIMYEIVANPSNYGIESIVKNIGNDSVFK